MQTYASWGGLAGLAVHVIKQAKRLPVKLAFLAYDCSKHTAFINIGNLDKQKQCCMLQLHARLTHSCGQGLDHELTSSSGRMAPYLRQSSLNQLSSAEV